MHVDLTDAISLTKTVVSDKSKEEGAELKKVTTQNTLKDVLQGPHKFYYWKQTPKYIVAQVDIKEGNQSWYLIAIPKVNGVTPVYCLMWTSTSKSELRYWNGKSEKTQTLYHTDGENLNAPDIEQVFTSETDQNLCFSFGDYVRNYRGMHSSPMGKQLICRELKTQK